MSFEVKYDKDRNPIMPAMPAEPQEQAQQEPELPIIEEAEALPVEESIIPISPSKPSVPQESWKTLRDKALNAEKRAQALEQQLLDSQGRNQPELPQEDLNFSVEDDALVEGKHLSKVDKKIRNLENQLRQYQEQSNVNSAESRLKAQYPDFDSVVSKENLEALRMVEPELSHSINSNTDLYAKAVSAYKMIKKFGLYQEDTFQEEKAIIQKNASKPKPSQTVSPQTGDSPLNKANAFATGKISDDMKAQLWKEMKDLRQSF